MNEIKHIVFDIGNVLIGWNMELAFLEQIPDEEERDWFFQNVCTPQWNIEQDRGRDWRVAEELLIAEHRDHAENIRAFRGNWEMMITGEISGSVEILKSLLANGHDVTMLTNFASDTFEIAKRRFDFLALSRGTTVSADIKMIKPDAEIYHHHANSFDLTPEHCLFIDDSQKNVDGAINAGWQAVLFQNAKTLKDDLERFEIRV